MKPYSVDTILSKAKAMDDFIHDLANHNMTNMSGGAYRQVNLCYYKDGILLISYHHVNNYCSIEIVDNPKADFEVFRGCQDSRYPGNPHPVIHGARWVTVWSGGKWTKNGPWQKKIIDLLNKLTIDLEDKIKQQEIKVKQQKLEYEKQHQEYEKSILENWS